MKTKLLVVDNTLHYNRGHIETENLKGYFCPRTFYQKITNARRGKRFGLLK